MYKQPYTSHPLQKRNISVHLNEIPYDKRQIYNITNMVNTFVHVIKNIHSLFAPKMCSSTINMPL